MGLLGFSAAYSQIPISPTLFGQNAWYIDINDNNASTFSSGFDSHLSDVAQSGVKYVRIGGIGVNFSPLYSWGSGYSITSVTQVQRLKHLIDAIRTNSMEPVIQVGYDPLTPSPCASAVGPLGGISLSNQALIAGNLVKFLNDPSTGIYSTRPIVYWVIANEPDHAYSCSSSNLGGYGWNGGTSTATVQAHANTIATYIKAFSTQMKLADPTIKIIGPELSAFGNDNYMLYNPVNHIMDELVTAPTYSNSIMGQIPSTTNYYIDILSFHHYPNYNISTRADVISEPGTMAADGFRSDLIATGFGKKGVVDMITGNSTLRSVSNLSVACTEFNLLVNNGIDESSNYSGLLNGLDNRSFIAGQWMADIFSQAMNATTSGSGGKSWVSMMNLWSVEEGNPPCTTGLGYISGCVANRKRSEYWHYWMLARNFKGNFYMGNSTLSNVKVFTSTNCDQIAVMLLNEDLNAQTANITFNTSYGASNTKLNQGATVTYTATLNGEESQLLLFDPCGKFRGGYAYNKSLNLSDAAPSTITGSTGNFCTCNNGGGGGGTGRMAMPEKDHRDVSVISQPNPHNGQGAVYVQLGDASQGELTITDAFGKMMDRIVIPPGREVIPVDYTNYPAGVYMLNLSTDKAGRATSKMLIVK